MDRIACLSKDLNEFFNEKADEISIAVGFIKRKRKLNGSSFIKAMVFGNIGVGDCSIETMCQLLNEDSIEITKQGLDYISLPSSMEDMYKGYGSSYRDCESNTKSGIKLQLVFDYLNQALDKLNLIEGIRSDQGYRDYLNGLSANDLLIFDLGYFVPSSFKQIDEAGAYFVSRYKSDTNIYDIETNQKIELLECLEGQSLLEMEVLLGKEVKIKVRIICQKLTEEQSIIRRRANKLAKSHGYTSSQKNQKLLDWSIFITNVPESKISAEQVLTVYRVRWQIELLFKLYKSHIRLDELKGKPYRVLCELYAKLCAILIFHGIVGCIKLKENTELSLTKAFIELKRRIRELFLALSSKINNLRIFLKKLTTDWSQFSVKDRYRKTRVSTLSSLNFLTLAS
ncbi:IS4 family transposase [Wolbachia endosymbiont (group A) of Anomoia purmunda]|uniref:IS4 family transposase n=1 Tax=Wolbachia endosymbiont (group A) of Anomoia purmunda TaxID=2953978 RepID=UPI00223042D8|nr:IS4 family transposase [Wolbachia endosymbiont (group A) of Anomoia purmunda]